MSSIPAQMDQSIVFCVFIFLLEKIIVIRKLAELGYHRSAKKCKEKFENVYKYHKRTKESRTGKSEGKNYRFFEQLEALDHHHHHHQNLPLTNLSPTTPTQSQRQPPPLPPPPLQNPPSMVPNVVTVTSTTNSTVVPIVAMPQNIVTPPTINFANPSSSSSILLPPPPPPPLQQTTTATTNPFASSSLGTDISTSSSTSSDVELEKRGRKRKRKWKDFYERLMMEVVNKQEALQRRFLEAIEKREQERMAREEAWRMQEMSRINREREILTHERAMAAAKDQAVMAFLQKISEQQNLQPGLAAQINNNQPQSAQPPPPEAAAAAATPPPAAASQLAVVSVAPPPLPPQALQLPQSGVNLDSSKTDNGDQNFSPKATASGASSSRWPKIEVQALIKLRTSLDSKYQETGPKGPLWEEISSGMKMLGFNRNAKRCKEKWENINKYFKKVKESNKKRPEDSKTCPYFHQLEALYKEKNKLEGSSSTSTSNNNQQVVIKPENTVPLMVRPEQQWPPAPLPPELHHHHRPDSVTEDQNQDDDDEEDDDYDENEDKDGDDDEEEDEGGGGSGGFEIVANKPVASIAQK